jgi:hypothetical protein
MREELHSPEIGGLYTRAAAARLSMIWLSVPVGVEGSIRWRDRRRGNEPKHAGVGDLSLSI